MPIFFRNSLPGIKRKIQHNILSGYLKIFIYTKIIYTKNIRKLFLYTEKEKKGKNNKNIYKINGY